MKSFAVLICILANLFSFGLFAAPADETDKKTMQEISSGLSELSRIILAECLNAKETLGDSVWPGWSNFSCPINFVTNEYEYLIGFDLVPKNYHFLEHDPLLNADIYYKKREFKQLIVGSLLPYHDRMVVFMSPPEVFIDTFKINVPFFRILLLHELFHGYQLSNFPGGFDGLKSFSLEQKYPYKLEPNNQMRAKEAALLKKAILASSKKDAVRYISQFLESRQKRRTLLLKKYPDQYTEKSIVFEKYREWQEGEARYTEVKFDQILKLSDYRSIPSYIPYCSDTKDIYAMEIKKLDYVAQNSAEESDYALGWAQWYLLDTLYPEWKENPFSPGMYPEELLQKEVF